jgi:tRNA threonylcarbamoyladenosine biosynthesis protein TsaE
MTAEMEVLVRSVDETRALGAALGGLLTGGECVALEGPLGAGKTHFVQGLARGLGVPAEEPVVSPTFVLVREYGGRLTLYHIDSYRLADSAELYELGLAEMLAQPDAVVAIEWADRTPEAVPAGAVWVALAHVEAEVRRVAIAWGDGVRLGALRGWQAG